MKTLTKRFLPALAALALTGSSLWAQVSIEAKDQEARITLKGKNSGITLEGLEISSGAKFLALGGQSATTSQTLTCEISAKTEWTPFRVRFKPDKDGKVLIYLRGSWNKDSAIWVLFDGLEAKGAWLGNGSFEEGDAVPTYWSFVKPPAGLLGLVVKDEGVAKDGKVCLQVWHDAPAVQNLKVTGGTEVTLTGYVRFVAATEKSASAPPKATAGATATTAPVSAPAPATAPASKAPDAKAPATQPAKATPASDDSPTKLRIQLKGGKEGITLEALEVSGGGTFVAAGDKEEKSGQTLTGELAVRNDQWTPFTFRFKPDKSGKVLLYYRSNSARGKKVWVLYDGLEAKGAWLGNGGFEELSDSGVPTYWSLPKAKDEQAQVVKDKSVAKDGEACLKVWHNCPGIQSLKVTGGTEVTLTGYARLLEVTDQ